MNSRIITAVAVITMGLASCSSGSTSSEVATLETAAATAESTTTTVAVDTEGQLLAFSECMREAGIDIDDPTVDADGNVEFGGFRSTVEVGEEGGGPPDGFREAAQTCGELLEGLELGFGRPDLTELQDSFLEYAQCMRDNGYDMDDPDLSGFGLGAEDGEEGEGGVRGVNIFGDVDPTDPTFIAAQEACQDVLAGFGPGGGGPRPGEGDQP